MKCPMCNNDATETRQLASPDVHFTITHYYSCDCGLNFKSSEKVIFTSLPHTLREQFLNTGERKWMKYL